MMNNTIKILDNTGCYFYSENDYLVLDYALAGFSGFNKDYCGYTIPYLCRNKSNQYEVGIGVIDNIGDKLILRRQSISLSSNNNNPVSFPASSGNSLFCFANSYNFKTGLNNFVNSSGHFIVENNQALYFVDLTNSNATATLPSAQLNKGLTVEFQTSDNIYNNLTINDTNNNTICILRGGSYAKLVSTGSDWLQLKTNVGSVQSLSSPSFSSLSTEAADPSGSLQYNDGSYLAGSNVYVDSATNKLLFGSSSEETAYIIMPTSGSYPTVFNNLSSSSDLIIKGSGDKNLFFGYEGRLGLNIPSGARPQTALHIVNNSCQDAIRLENRNPCYAANFTLYHKPSTIISDNTIISTINLSAKNSVNNQTDFVQLKARALSSSEGATSGEFIVAVDKLGYKIDSLIINPNYSTLLSSTNSIKVSSSGIDMVGTVRLSSLRWMDSPSSGSILVSDSNGNLILTNVSNSPIIDLLDPGVVVFTGVCT